MVDDLLSELMAELGVTQDQFVAACEKASGNPLHRKIVDQISAVDNFVAFKKLMVKRNTELNEQAIKMMSGGAAAGQPPLPG
jgi:protein-disulfide isomerase-like protein with CxxC motif